VSIGIPLALKTISPDLSGLPVLIAFITTFGLAMTDLALKSVLLNLIYFSGFDLSLNMFNRVHQLFDGGQFCESMEVLILEFWLDLDSNISLVLELVR
jgi:hypothetical protein